MRKIILSIIVFICAPKDNVTAQYWSALGSGMAGVSDNNTNFNAATYTLEVYNGELYAGGMFDSAGGSATKNIAKWNGANWEQLGIGITGSETWPASVASLAVFNNELYVGGVFDSAGGLPAKNIAKWNGMSWSAVGDGIGDVWKGVGFVESVNSLVVYNGELYASGFFTKAGGISAINIAKWNGTSWLAVGGGVGIVWPGTGLPDIALSLTEYNGALYVGGKFLNAGGIAVNNIAKWNATNWSSPGIGVNDIVYDMIAHNGALYIAGRFSSSVSMPANNIVKWDGANPSALNSGTDGPVYTVSFYNGSLYAGGYFYYAGGIASPNMAKWNGYNWSAVGSSVNDIVMSTDTLNGSLYAGGHFTHAGNVEAMHIAKWSDQCTAAPPQPGNISGTACSNHYSTFSVIPVNNAADYTWLLPAGWSGNSIDNSIRTIVGDSSGIISVIANNPCGSSIAQTLVITVYPVPQKPGPIIGNNTVCENSIQTYSIAPATGGINYTWSLPSGWIGSTTTNSITVTPGTESGIISVVANNNYCGSDAETFEVTANPVPAKPDLYLNGPVCKDSSQTYSVDPIPGATSYTWTLPSGWTGYSSTTSITVTIGNNNGNISVNANNSCGAGYTETALISVDSVPSQPNAITGEVFVTVGQIGRYSINSVNRASNYTWSLSGGGKIITDQSTTTVSIDWNTPGNYILSVKANNNCGGSSNQTLAVTVSIATGISNPANSFEIKLLPNPSYGEFYLKAKEVQSKVINVEVLNMAGQLVYRSGKKQGANDYTQLINLDKMPQGIYAVKIIVDDKVYVRSVVMNN